jgi:anti-sigma regulatory factor (Ser/Thr protein kinase)
LKFSASFPGTPEGARAARHFVRDALAASDHQLRDTILLLTSEVATNAVRHAGAKFHVGIESLETDGVRVEVTDDNSLAPQPQMAPVDATTGRGLDIVDALASAWGVDDRGNGKVVWFEVRSVSPRSQSDQPGR